MKRSIVLMMGAAWLLGGGLARGQEPLYAEDMRFVNALRQRGDNDLALALLQRLSKNAPPELAAELPLEMAKTRMGLAADESDSNKRMAVYLQARQDFEAFLTANPNHPRASEIKLDIAQVSVLQGRTELSRALMQDTPDARRTDGAKARSILEDAGKKLRDVSKELDAKWAKIKDQAAKTPAEAAEKKKVEEQHLLAELEVALNVFDQARSYPSTDPSNDVLRQRGKMIDEASKLLEKIASGDEKQSVVWQAKAWLGRCIHELGDPNKAREAFQGILDASTIAARDAQRLARYFRLLVITEQKKEADWAALVEEAGERWVKDYPRHLKSNEGYGLRYLLAQLLINKADNPMLKLTPVQKKAALDRARKFLREVEQEDNEYTDLAKRMKIGLIVKQGGFNKPVKELTTFEDCFVRAQYESIQMAEDANTIKDDKVLEKKRQERIDTILAVLERGLVMPDAKGKASTEINQARQLVAQLSFHTKRYPQAIKAGEDFARNDPRSGQASLAAAFALQAYAMWIDEREQQLDGNGEFKDEKGQKIDDETFLSRLNADRKKMLDFAAYAKERWPREIAGDLAKHQMALTLLRKTRVREKSLTDEEKAKNTQEAIKVLGEVTPGYPSYVLAKYLLGEKALQAEKDGLALPAGEKRSYRQQALEALQSIPDTVSGDPEVNRHMVLSRCMVGEELYKDKKYEQMQQAVTPVLAKLPTLVVSEDKDRLGPMREYFQNRLSMVNLFATYGLADAEFQAGRYAKALEYLNPLVDQVIADKLPAIKNNAQLGSTLMSMALRASIQLGQLDRARVVAQTYQKVSGDDMAAGGTPPILKLLVFLIDRQVTDLKDKKDKDGLKKAKEGFTAILDDVIKQQTKLTSSFKVTLAQCYAGLEEFDRAAGLLNQITEPKAMGNTPVDPEEERIYKGSRLLYIRMMRQAKQFDKAQKALDEIMGTEMKKGWGASDIAVLKEKLALLVDKGDYGNGYVEANKLVKALKKKAETDPAMKEHYLDCYFQMVYCMVMFGKGQKEKAPPNPMKAEKAFADAATLLDQLDKDPKFTGFGNDATKKRILDLMDKEPDFKKAYDKLKTK